MKPKRSHSTGIRPLYGAQVAIAASLLLLCCLGCTRQKVGLTLTSYLQPDQPKQYTQDFNEGWFSQTSKGQYQIVLKYEDTSGSAEHTWVTQIISMALFWQPQPGMTFVESSQINARIQYLMLSDQPPDAHQSTQQPTERFCYRGTGFVTFKLTKRGKAMKGWIESGNLKPHADRPDDLFGRFTLTGRFKATSDAAAVQRYRKMAADFCRD